MTTRTPPRRTSPDPWAAAKLSVDAAELGRLTRHRDPVVRIMAATNPHTPVEDRATLLADPDNRVSHAALSATPSLPWQHVAANLPHAPHPMSLRVHLVHQARSGFIPDRELATLISPEGVLADTDTVVAITRCSNIGGVTLGPETFAAAAMHPSALVRQQVAANPHCPEEVLIVLADDPDRSVCGTIARRNPLPGDVILTLARRREYTIREEVASVHGKWLFRHADTHILHLYAQDTRDATLLCTLAPHTDPVVRRAVATNPITLKKVSIMKAYVADDDPTVRSIAAHTYHFSLVSGLVDDPCAEVRSALTGNPDITSECLAALAQDSDPRVAEAAGVRLLHALAA